MAWQFLAIRSGQLAGMVIDRSPLIRAERFVDSCGAGPEGAKMSRYCYMPGGQPTLSLTGAGLLTREYLGWRRDNPDLLVGCKYLMENLPPESGSTLGPMYYTTMPRRSCTTWKARTSTCGTTACANT